MSVITTKQEPLLGHEMGGSIRAPLTLWRRTIRHLRIPMFARSGASKPLSFVTLIARGAYYLLKQARFEHYWIACL